MINDPEESNLPPAQFMSDLEGYLERVSSPEQVAYEETVAKDRAVVISQLIEEGCLANQLTHEGTAYGHLEVLPILNEKGEIARTLGEILQNRYQLNSDFAQLAGQDRHIAHHSRDRAEEMFHNWLATDRDNWSYYYYADYLALHFVTTYNHGLQHSKSDHLKRMD